MSIQKLKASIISEKNKPLIVVDYDKVAKLIGSMELPDDISKKLLQKARSMPYGSLPHFVSNINLHIKNLSGDKNDKQK